MSRRAGRPGRAGRGANSGIADRAAGKNVVEMKTSKIEEHSVQIGGRTVGGTAPCYVIAEAGVNHNGELDLALKLVDAAKAAGADAVKFQTFIAKEIASESAPTAAYQRDGTSARSQLELLEPLELSQQAHEEIQTYCREVGIEMLSTAADLPSVALLDALGLAAFKVGSAEITNIPLLRAVADRGRPIILSTGMATLSEVERAVQTLRDAGAMEICLLHCVSAYPMPAEQANLRAMQTLHRALNVPVGFSDHSEGDTVAVAAVALGAKLIEKHLTLDRNLPGPDHQASLEPEPFAQLVQRIRLAEAALGDGNKAPQPIESEVAAVVRRSLVAKTAIQAGERFSAQNLACKRPATGISAVHWDALLGKSARQAIAAGALIAWDDVAASPGADKEGI